MAPTVCVALYNVRADRTVTKQINREGIRGSCSLELTIQKGGTSEIKRGTQKRETALYHSRAIKPILNE